MRAKYLFGVLLCGWAAALPAFGDERLSSSVDELEGLRADCLSAIQAGDEGPLIQMGCAEAADIWLPTAEVLAGKTSLENRQEIVVSMRTISRDVQLKALIPQTIQMTNTCRYELWRVTVPRFVETLTCEAFLRIASLAAHCKQVIETKTRNDPSFIIREPLGQVREVCG